MKGVAFLCFLVFVKSSLVLCKQDGEVQGFTPRRSFFRHSTLGCGKADTVVTPFKNLLGRGNMESVYIYASTGCQQNGAPPQSDNRDLQFTPTAACRVGLENGDPRDPSDKTPLHNINVLTKTDPDVEGGVYNFLKCPTNSMLYPHEYEGYFLPYSPNKNTYMFLDAGKAKWFFTSRLSGCDIFIATSRSNSKKPLVIHSNKNGECDNVKRFREKGEQADAIIAGVPGGYTLQLRVYGEDLKVAGVPEEVAKYKKDHPTVQTVVYDVDEAQSEFYFTGFYDNSSWKYFLRPTEKGANIPIADI